MFVPRALRLKGVKESQKSKKEQPAQVAAQGAEISSEDALVTAMQQTSTTSPATLNEQVDPKSVTRGPRFTTTPITPEYIAQLTAGIELIFTDYAHQNLASAKWLRERYRTVNGEEKFIHLTAILEHANIASLKPEATQVLVRKAIQQHASSKLQLSENGFYVRRRSSTYPLSFIPQNSFSVVDDNGLGFWDQRTIYVEPHVRHFCKTPAKVAHWLQEHGQIKQKWLPIQAVQTLYNSCGFVVLSGNVMHEDVWKKWRSAEKPVDWKVMTKVEHTKRTNEYLELLDKSRRDLKRKHNVTTVTEEAGTGADAPKVPSATKHKKRKRAKSKVNDDLQEQEDADMGDDTVSEGVREHPGKRTA
ncbi:hypothetical protein K458DRAFT_384005 [Lentithecium fluviatile CBS 122367]|uniref:Uncharacterized protein n=1 Tax=Lentithecium fluviatile CBS 122367 TaxID=1168545 RepID=A0A6G1JFK9_9PLEO|nr:hypothetical protein K458DRAFT_384005 [Lentithecium fluviatile CBS 122367]